MNDEAIYKASASYLRATVGYSEMRKRSSAFMWFLYAISFMWIWNRRFMDGFHTTVFGRIYWADGVRDWRTLWHECLHRKQAIGVGEPKFSLTYLFPVPLALLALLALFAIPFTNWHLLWLGSFAFLGPWPAPWRVRYEREAYLISAVCDALRGWDLTSEWYLNYQVENHCGWAYWRPSWQRTHMRRVVRDDIQRALRIVNGEERTDYTDELIRIVRAA